MVNGEALKSNCQTTSIFCGDCEYLAFNKIGHKCDQFTEQLRVVMDGRIECVIKGKECIKYGSIKP